MRRYLSMQVVFMVSSLMYNISVAWANLTVGVKRITTGNSRQVVCAFHVHT